MHHKGCRCAQCYTLAEFMLEETGRDHGLPRAPGHGPSPALSEACAGTMTCPCSRCRAERDAALQRPRRTSRLPWEPIPLAELRARRAA